MVTNMGDVGFAFFLLFLGDHDALRLTEYRGEQFSLRQGERDHERIRFRRFLVRVHQAEFFHDFFYASENVLVIASTLKLHRGLRDRTLALARKRGRGAARRAAAWLTRLQALRESDLSHCRNHPGYLALEVRERLLEPVREACQRHALPLGLCREWGLAAFAGQMYDCSGAQLLRELAFTVPAGGEKR